MKRLPPSPPASGSALLERGARIAGIGAWMLDLQTQALVWTEQAAALLGLAPNAPPALAQLIGHFAPEGQIALHAALEAAQRRAQGFELELLLLTASDQRLWVRLVAEVELEQGRPRRLHGSVQDVSARRAAQQEAQRSAELLRAAIDAIDQAFALYDPQDRLVFCNDRFRQLYPGLAELIEPGLRFESLLQELVERGLLTEAIGREAEWIAQRLRERRAGPVTGLRALSDGRVLRVIDRQLSDGHVVSFRIDLTEHVRATERAQEATAAKSRFLATMSHEIRTPLHAVLGMLELLGHSGLTLAQDAYLQQARTAARGLLALLNDSLDFAKIEAGRLELERQPFDAAAWWAGLCGVLQGARAEPGPSLRFEFDPTLPPIWLADALRLRQVLLNLGSNALKFTAAGAVVVSARRLALEGRRVQIEFCVSDTGIGISAAQQARLFSAFAQAEASTTRRYGGTGLGLAISQRLVEAMGGRLELQSQAGQGSRFFFNLWLGHRAELPDNSAATGAATTAAAPQAPKARLAGLRLLLVEDNPVNQQIARELLGLEGATVGLAVHGAQALQVLRQERFDAVLMDLQMPEMDGFEATRRIRGELGLAHLPIIAMSANASPADRAACLAAGMDEHLGKPFDLGELVATVQRVCRPPSERPGASQPEAAQHSALARLGGQPEVYRRALLGFAQEVEALPEHLPPALARLLHTLAGNAATLGADALAARLQALQRQLQQSPEEAAALYAQAAQVCRAESQGLRALAATLAPPAAASAAAAVAAQGVGGTGLVERLQQLLACLEQSDLAALDLVGALRPWAGPARRVPLEQALDALDFEGAARLVRDWLQDARP